jgi:hypothetical protein
LRPFHTSGGSPAIDRRLMLQFRGSVLTSDAGLLAYRELDDVLGLTAMAGEMLADARTGKNGRHALIGLLRRSVFGRLAGYEDVNDVVYRQSCHAARTCSHNHRSRRSARHNNSTIRLRHALRSFLSCKFCIAKFHLSWASMAARQSTLVFQLLR